MVFKIPLPPSRQPCCLPGASAHDHGHHRTHSERSEHSRKKDQNGIHRCLDYSKIEGGLSIPQFLKASWTRLDNMIKFIYNVRITRPDAEPAKSARQGIKGSSNA
jgi:hypothetical protein